MNNIKLCSRLGLVTGGAVGLLIGLLHGFVCCTPPAPPTWSELALDGLLVALIAGIFAAAFARLVTRINSGVIFMLTLIISIFTGVLLGPLAYLIPFPWLAFLLCSLLGAVLGWLVCMVMCRGKQMDRRGCNNG
jgi:hypothetical protein